MTLGAKTFDRTIGGEGGLLINRGKVGKEKDRGRKMIWWDRKKETRQDFTTEINKWSIWRRRRGFYLVEALKSMWINVCASIVGCQSSVEHEDLCTDMLLKAYWWQFPPFWPRPTKIFYGVSERHHVIYWIYLCDVFRMCFCYLLDRKLFLYSYDIVKLLCILYFTPFTTLVNSW